MGKVGGGVSGIAVQLGKSRAAAGFGCVILPGLDGFLGIHIAFRPISSNRLGSSGNLSEGGLVRNGE